MHASRSSTRRTIVIASAVIGTLLLWPQTGFAAVGSFSSTGTTAALTANNTGTGMAIRATATGTHAALFTHKGTNASGGVFAQSSSTTGFGVRGYSSALTGSTAGVHGTAASSSAKGVYGQATRAAGLNYGVYGKTASPTGFGVFSDGPLGTNSSLSCTGCVGLGDMALGLDTVHQPSFTNSTVAAGATPTRTSSALGVDGLGLIAYHDGANEDLKIAHCVNIGCTSVTTATLDSTGAVGESASLGIGADGLGVVAYLDTTNDKIKVAHCTNTRCSSASVVTLLPGTSYDPFEVALAIGTDGLPLIAYWDGLVVDEGDVKTIHCGNAICSLSDSPVIVDGNEVGPTQNVGSDIAVGIGADGFPFLAYQDIGAGETLRVAHCLAITCTSSEKATIDARSGSGAWVSVALGADGRMLLAYLDEEDGKLRVAHCDDIPCATASVTTFGDGGQVSLKVSPDGFGVMSYGSASMLQVSRCSNITCSAITTIAADASGVAGSSTSLIIGADSFPLISQRGAADEESLGQLRVTHCTNRFCLPHVRG